MKISSKGNVVLDLISVFLFFIGVLIFLKIGFSQWIIWCSILFFFIAKDERFIKSITPDPNLKNFPIYGIIWAMTLLMPVIVILTYIGTRFSGYSQDYDDE